MEAVVHGNVGAVRRIAFAAIALGVLGDQLLRAGLNGVGPALWLLTGILALAALTAHTPSPAIAERRVVLALLAAAGLLLAWRDAGELSFLALTSCVALALLAAGAFRGERMRSLTDVAVVDAAESSARALVSTGVGAIPLVFRDLRDHPRPAALKRDRLLPVFRGALITIPVAAILAALFIEADPTLSSFVEELRIDPEAIMSHLLLAGVLTWIAAGYLRYVGLPPASVGPAAPRRLPVLGEIEVGMLLGAMNVLFTVFVALQLPRMFLGERYVIAEMGLTFAEYARRGFFELIAASMVTLAVIMGVQSVTADTGRARRLVRMLGGLSVALIFVILQSAVHRLGLYVNAFGWTVDRMYATGAIAWLALTFGWSAVTLLGGRPRRFIAGAAAAAALVLLALAGLNPQGAVVTANAARARTLHDFDFRYVGYSLGRDAVPALARALPSLPAAQPVTIGDCHAIQSLLVRTEGPVDWRRWTLSALRARSARETVARWSRRFCAPGLRVSRASGR